MADQIGRDHYRHARERSRQNRTTMIRVEPHEVLNHLVDETESRLVDYTDIEAFAASTATTGYHARRMFFILGRRATVRVCTSTAGGPPPRR